MPNLFKLLLGLTAVGHRVLAEKDCCYPGRGLMNETNYLQDSAGGTYPWLCYDPSAKGSEDCWKYYDRAVSHCHVVEGRGDAPIVNCTEIGRFRRVPDTLIMQESCASGAVANVTSRCLSAELDDMQQAWIKLDRLVISSLVGGATLLCVVLFLAKVCWDTRKARSVRDAPEDDSRPLLPAVGRARYGSVIFLGRPYQIRSNQHAAAGVTYEGSLNHL